MAAPIRISSRIEQRRANYFDRDEKILALTVANPQRTNTFALASFLGSVVALRKLAGMELLPATAVGVLGALVGVLGAALLAQLTVRGLARSIPRHTNYLVLTDRRLVVIRCWPWGTPGKLAAAFAFDNITGFDESKALVTSRLGIDFSDGSRFVGDVHGMVAADFAAAGNAWAAG